MRNPLRRREKALTASGAVIETLENAGINSYVRFGGVNQQVNAAFLQAQSASYAFMYRQQPAVRTVVDLIARNVAQLGLKLYERSAEADRNPRNDHPAAQVMAHPNTLGPGDAFVRDYVADYLVHDNAYAAKVRRNPNDPVTLIRLPPASIMIISSGLFTIDYYRVFAANGQYTDIQPEDMIHWRGYNAQDALIGISRLETLRQELAVDAATQTALVELMKSGLASPGHIRRPLEAPAWSEEARARFEEAWANRAKGATKKTPVLEEGMTFEEGSVTPKDAELLASRTFTLAQVARLYGVPLGLIGITDSPRNLPEEHRQFYADVLPPITESLAAQLDFSLCEAEYNDDSVYFEFNVDEKLRGDLETKLNTLVSVAGAPFMTRNEVRALQNLPALPDGDELITPLNVTVGGKPSPVVMPIQDPNAPPQDGSHRLQGTNGHSKDLLLPRRAAASERRDRWAKEYEGVLRATFERQEQVTKSKGVVKALNDSRWNSELAKDLDSVAARHAAEEGKIIAGRLAGEFDPGQVKNYLLTKSSAAAEAINRTTDEQIGALGASEAFSRARETRAAGAGMEMASGVAAFSLKAAIQQGPHPQKRMVVIDGGDCEICSPYQGVWPIAEVPGWPGYHPNCNCVCDVQ